MSESRRHLAKFAAIFAGGTMISRVSGLARDVLTGALMPHPAWGAFNIAFRFPNMLRDLVGEGASNAAFIPVLSETLEKESEKAFREAVSAIMSAMIVLLGVITILGVLFMPMIFRLLGSVSSITGADQVAPEYVGLMESLTRWTFPYIFFIGLTVFQMGPLFIMRRYSTPSWSPALLNVAQMFVCIWWYFWPGFFSDAAFALVLGCWIGGIAQFLVQYVSVGRHVGVWKPNFHLRHPSIRAAFWLLVPVILGQSAGEVNKFVDTLFATSMGYDVVNALYVSNRLVQLPLAMFGIGISVAILPSISRAATRSDFVEIRETLIQGFRQSYFLVGPALAALVAIPKPIVALLFQYGRFKAYNTELAGTALIYLAGGLLCFAWVKVAVSGFYSVKETRTPVAVAFVSMLLNIALIFVLTGPARMGFRGLALATTLSYTVNFLLLYLLLSRRFGAMWNTHFLSSVARITVATAVMGVVLYAAHAGLQSLLPADRVIFRILRVGAALGTGGLAYLGLCALLHVSDAQTFLSILRGRRS
jgi:putative peptidoglycan lipid II flippase